MILKLSVKVYLDVIHRSTYLLLVSTTNVPDNGVELCLADGLLEQSQLIFCAVVQLVGFTKFTSRLTVQGFNIYSYSLTQLLLYIIV